MDAVEHWHALLLADGAPPPAFCDALAASMRDRRLTFGDRVHCPFLRPFFLSSADEARIRTAAEALAAAGERVVRAAVESPALAGQLGITEAEEALIRIDPGYHTASTASRVDAFVLPGALYFAEYNAESPAGAGYTQRLCELFDGLEVMGKFRAGHDIRFHRPIDRLLEALMASYREWGGTARPPAVAIVDWRDVPTWSEFEILADAFRTAGVPAIVRDPRELTFERGSLTAQGQRIDLVYRRVLINDIVARREACEALVAACAARAACVANTFRCKLAHKKAFFAVLTDPRNEGMFSRAELDVIRSHVPWTRLLRDGAADRHGRRTGLLDVVRRERETLVLKPNDEYGGTGVTLGWEQDERAWDAAVDRALADPAGTWIVQDRIPVRRETFPRFDAEGRVTMGDMLVDLAPYLFRGRMGGFLTRLSGSGLANVTSGGGQVPAFVVD